MTTYIVEVKGRYAFEVWNTCYGKDNATAASQRAIDYGHAGRIIEVDADAGTAKIIAEFAPEKWEKRWLTLFQDASVLAQRYKPLVVATHETATIPIEIDFARGKIRQVDP